MYKNPENPPMKSSSEQYNFYGKPSRFFYMKASMFGIPARILHAYSEENATMQVKVAYFYDMMNLSAEELSILF
jgi:hypothetical protein